MKRRGHEPDFAIIDEMAQDPVVPEEEPDFPSMQEGWVEKHRGEIYRRPNGRVRYRITGHVQSSEIRPGQVIHQIEVESLPSGKLIRLSYKRIVNEMEKIS